MIINIGVVSALSLSSLPALRCKEQKEAQKEKKKRYTKRSFLALPLYKSDGL